MRLEARGRRGCTGRGYMRHCKRHRKGRALAQPRRKCRVGVDAWLQREGGGMLVGPSCQTSTPSSTSLALLYIYILNTYM